MAYRGYGGGRYGPEAKHLPWAGDGGREVRKGRESRGVTTGTGEIFVTLEEC